MGDQSRSETGEIVDCAHRLFSGLRCVHSVCSGERHGKIQYSEQAVDLLRTAFIYRRVSMAPSIVEKFGVGTACSGVRRGKSWRAGCEIWIASARVDELGIEWMARRTQALAVSVD